MGTVVVFKGIKPQRLNVDQYRKKILNAMRKDGTQQRKVLRKTTRTWRGDKPKFETAIGLSRQRGGGATVTTGPGGSKKGAQKWGWLDEGTKIRWALMSGDWRSKTTVGHFGSRKGKGRVVLVGKRAFRRRGIRPRPGIKARNWSQILTKQRKRPFQRAMIATMKAAAKGSFR